MDATDWFLLILTFFTGVFLGALLYVTSFKPLYLAEDLNVIEDEAMEFSVAGRSYGGMRADYIHPSFRVLADGSFVYVTGETTGNAAKTYEAILPAELKNKLVEAVTSSNLESLTVPADKACRIARDGVDYSYQITLAGVSYQLDTCQTNLDYKSDLNLALEDVWSYLRDPISYRGGDKGAATIMDNLTKYLNDQIGVNNEK